MSDLAPTNAGPTDDAPPELVLERQGAVLVIRLNRPEARNALTPGMMGTLGSAVIEAEADPDIRVVLLTATGHRAFCAGMDLRAFSSGGSQAFAYDEKTAGFRQLVQGEVSTPIVGAATGSAVAGGLELLLACDIIVAASDAKFGLPEVKRGMFAAGGGTFIGTRAPLSVALEMGLTGDSIDAARAYELGLVNQVVAPDEVEPSALALADRIAANGPLGVQATKELIRLAVTDDRRARERLSEWQHLVFNSEDAREGAMAFVEKREPEWRGR